MKNRNTPTKIEKISGIVDVAAGKWHCLALNGMKVTVLSSFQEIGRLFAWGYGKSGRLGQGDELSHYRPKPINGYNRVHFTSCAAGLSHSLAVAGL